jgi:hypothetical protein
MDSIRRKLEQVIDTRGLSDRKLAELWEKWEPTGQATGVIINGGEWIGKDQ